MKSNNVDNTYLTKIIIISIVVLINILAVIGVIKTVGSAIKNLEKDIKFGKISNTQDVTEENNFSQAENNSYEKSSESFGARLLKLIALDKNVRKSFILLIIGIILIGVAIWVLIKISK